MLIRQINCFFRSANRPRAFSFIARIAPIFWLCTVFIASSQTIPSKVDSVLSLADSLRRAGLFPRARELYSSIKETSPSYVKARIGRGKMLMTEGRYNLAWPEFEEILDLDSSSIESHFNYAISNREAARPVFWLFKTPYWNRATEHFEWVLAHDSLYEDVLYQYAVLLFHRKEYERSFSLGVRQALLKPNDPQAQSDLFLLYRLFTRSRSESDAEGWLKPQTSDIAQYFSGEMLRRKGQLNQARTLFQSLLGRPLTISRQPVELSIVRTFSKQNNADSVENYYWRAVKEISSPVDARFLFEDLKYCITTREFLLYETLTKPSEHRAFFEAFWSARNPTPAARLNPRLVEHYRRLLHAEEFFECNIFRQSLARSDVPIQDPVLYSLNQEFDDRGLMYIRLGKPDQTLRTDIDPRNVYESWMYRQTPEIPKMVFDFHLLSMEYNEWRLAPVQLNQQFLEDRVTWDVTYSNLLMAINRNSQSLEAGRLEDAARRFTQQNLTAGLETDRHTWETKIDPLRVVASLTTFRGEGRQTMVDISYSVPMVELAAKMGDTPQMLKLEIGVALTNRPSLPVWKRTDTLGLTLSKQSTGAILDLYRFNAAPDTYDVVLQVHPLGLDLLGDWRAKVRIPDYSGKEFTLSDVQILLPSPTKNRYQIEGIKVVPSPFQRYPLDQPLHIYFQAYELSLDALGRSAFSFEYRLDRVIKSEDIFQKVADIFRSKSKTTLTIGFEKEADSSTVSQYFPLGLGYLDPGEYVLTVRAVDKHTHKSIERTRRLELYRREESP